MKSVAVIEGSDVSSKSRSEYLIPASTIRAESVRFLYRPFIPLGSITQRSGKIVHAWAFEGDCDPTCMKSNMTTAEWPPRSGKHIDIPEIDRVQFFSIEDARRAINVAQAELLDRLMTALETS